MSDFYILKDKNDKIMRFKPFVDGFIITDEEEFPIFIINDIEKVKKIAGRKSYGSFDEPFNNFEELIITKVIINVTAEYPNLLV